MLIPTASSAARRWFVTLATCLVLPFTALPAMAQDDAAAEEENQNATMEKPIAMVAVSSVERLRSDIKYLFDVTGRPDIYETMEAGLENVGNLKGMDQTRPFGVMIFLRAGFPPAPEVVGYVPVDNIADLMKTVEIGPVVTRKVDGADDRYELISVQQEFQVRLQHGFAFIATSAELVDRDFPDPVRSTRGMTSRYDVAFTITLDSIPKGMRDLFMNVMKASAMSEMQQRDDEPIGQYKIRRANAEGTIQGITQMMEELERLTIGIDADPEKSNVALEIDLVAQEGSKLAKEMRDMNSKRNYFEPLVNQDSPLTMSASFPILEKDKGRTKDLLTGLELELARELNDGAEDGVLPPELAGMMQALRDTVDDGHLNMFLQFYGEPGSFIIVGGGRVVGGASIAAGLKDLLTRLGEDIDVELGEVELDVDQHNGVSFHQIQAKDVDDGAQRMFGGALSLYVGVGPRTVWFTVGGPDALDKLKELMDVLADPKTNTERDRSRKAPFRLVFNMRQWLGLDEDGEGVAHEAFADGGDRLTVDLQPTDNGMRIRAQMDEGFARLIGLSVARNFDRQAERRARRAATPPPAKPDSK